MADQPDPTNSETAQPSIPGYQRHRAPKTKPIRTGQNTDPAAQAYKKEYLDETRLAKKANRRRYRNNVVAEWLMAKSQEPTLTQNEFAKRKNMPNGTFKAWLREVSNEGAIKFDDALERLEYEIIPKVVENLKEFVDKKDRVVTLETAKGTIFKQFQAAQGIQEGGQMVLALKIESLPNEEPRTIAGVIVGQPKMLPE